MPVKFLFRHMVLNKHLAKGFQLCFLQDIWKGVLCTRKVLEKHPRPDLPAWTQTKHFEAWGRVTVQEAARAQKGEKNKEWRNLCVPGSSQQSQPLCHRNRFARLAAQEHFGNTSGCRTHAEQTYPAIQEANSWCSQHINTVVVGMLRIEQPSKNYFISFLASLILFF